MDPRRKTRESFAIERKHANCLANCQPIARLPVASGSFFFTIVGLDVTIYMGGWVARKHLENTHALLHTYIYTEYTYIRTEERNSKLKRIRYTFSFFAREKKHLCKYNTHKIQLVTEVFGIECVDDKRTGLKSRNYGNVCTYLYKH